MADPIEVPKRSLEALNADDWDAFRATFAADCVLEEFPTGRRLEGPDAVVEASQGWKQAFPDLHGIIRNLVACGSTVTVEVTWEGTHTGDLVSEMGTIPPSGKRLSVPAVLISEVEGDKIKATRDYFDLLTLLTQIGAVPAGAQ